MRGKDISSGSCARCAGKAGKVGKGKQLEQCVPMGYDFEKTNFRR